MIIDQLYKSKLNNYKLASIMLVVYMILINNMKNGVLGLLAILISLVFILKPVYILPPLFVASLLGEYFVAFNGIGLSRIFVLVFIVGSILTAVKERTKFNPKHVVMCLALCLFNIVSSATSITGTLEPAITMDLNILVLFFMYYTDLKDIKIYIKTMSLCLIILSLYTTYMVVWGSGMTVMDRGVSRIVLNELVNPNQLGLALAQIGAFLFGLIIVIKGKYHKALLFSVLMITTVNLILTGSRSSAVAVIVSILIVVLINLCKRGNASKKLIIIIVLLILPCIYLILANSGLEVMTRYSVDSVTEYGGTGRLQIWDAILRYIVPENPLFGVGFGGANVIAALEPYIGFNHGTHNILVTMLAQLGVIGAFIYIAFFIKSTAIIVKNYMTIDYLAMPLTMILAAFVNGIGEDIFSSRFLWIDIGLAFMIIRYSMSNHSEEVNPISPIKEEIT